MSEDEGGVDALKAWELEVERWSRFTRAKARLRELGRRRVEELLRAKGVLDGGLCGERRWAMPATEVDYSATADLRFRS